LLRSSTFASLLRPLGREVLVEPRASEAKVARPGAAIDQALGEAEDRPLDRERDQKLRPGDLAVLGLGGLLVGDPAPDEVEDLL
jgi:hypothetical protein